MNNHILYRVLGWVLLFGWAGQVAGQAPERCLAGRINQGVFPEREQMIAAWIGQQEDRVQMRSVVTIPVVVHVVWNKQEENIPDEQIQSQIDVLNADFRALNPEISGLPGVFKPLAADVEFEFCLARVDPGGNPTNGITRTFTINSVGIGGSSTVHYSDEGGQDAWDPDRYLNIWVAKFAGGVGGTSSFPGDGPPEEDGVVIDYRQFGTTGVEPPYHLGRTCTHEVGHYFNLEHPWGEDEGDCAEDDFVADTPLTSETYLSECPVHPAISCGTADMFMNYMYYTDDDCMGMFSIGQKQRMWAALNLFRTGLLEGLSICEPLSVIDEDPLTGFVITNPATTAIHVEYQGDNLTSWQAEVYDLAGRKRAERSFDTKVGIIEREVLPAGLYLVKIRMKDRVSLKKLVIY